MAGSTTKKVVVQRFDREPISGFVNPQTYLSAAGVELLSLSGNLIILSYEEIKTVYFVREFLSGDPGKEKREFATRPKTAGLWVRLRFRDGDTLEGILPNDLLQIEPPGFTLVPPDPLSNSQKVFIPRHALSGIHVAGVIGGGRRQRKRKEPAREQMKMFE